MPKTNFLLHHELSCPSIWRGIPSSRNDPLSSPSITSMAALPRQVNLILRRFAVIDQTSAVSSCTAQFMRPCATTGRRSEVAALARDFDRLQK